MIDMLNFLIKVQKYLLHLRPSNILLPTINQVCVYLYLLLFSSTWLNIYLGDFISHIIILWYKADILCPFLNGCHDSSVFRTSSLPYFRQSPLTPFTRTEVPMKPHSVWKRSSVQCVSMCEYVYGGGKVCAVGSSIICASDIHVFWCAIKCKQRITPHPHVVRVLGLYVFCWRQWHSRPLSMRESSPFGVTHGRRHKTTWQTFRHIDQTREPNPTIFQIYMVNYTYRIHIHKHK